MNLQQIYEKIKMFYEHKGIEISDDLIKQQAWRERDRMVFEKRYTSANNGNATGNNSGGRIPDNRIFSPEFDNTFN
jgi:hypothetical protein